ncbi:MAG: hypothetical protein KatS3mg054_0144 [Chloroflexus sp.]|nr:MAG: hypothetical protein KatS3mg054_0144 [Chloroflexus sp.]
MSSNIEEKLIKALMSLPPDQRNTAIRMLSRLFAGTEKPVDNALRLKDFIRQCWHVLEPDDAFVHAFFIDAIAEHLEAVARGDIRRLVICVPRRTGKSVICSVMFPAWLFSIDPSIRIICASYSLQFVRRDAIKTRDLIRSGWYQARYGDRVQIKIDQEQAHWFYTTRGGFRLATSPKSIGIGEGADIQIVDDPHKPNEVKSAAKRQEVIDWWENTMAASARDPRYLRRVVVQQRLHARDLAGVCIEKGYEALVLPMEYDCVKRSTSLGQFDIRTEKDELLFPERIPRREVEILKKELGPREYRAQYQQDPCGDEDQMFVSEKWVYWVKQEDASDESLLSDSNGKKLVILPYEYDLLVASWDVALTHGQDSNYTVGQIWGRSNGMIYLLDQVRFRGGLETIMSEFEHMWNKWPHVPLWLVEKSTATSILLELLQERFHSITPVYPFSDKVTRAEPLSAMHKEGLVCVPHPRYYDWVDKFTAELENFPRSAFDDQVDAAAQAALEFRKRRPLAFV